MLCRLPFSVPFVPLSPCTLVGFTRLAAALLVALVIAQTDLTPRAHGGLVLAPVAATTSSIRIGGSTDNLRNQSGLSIGYTSGVTDFDTYFASNPTTPSFSSPSNFLAVIGTTTNIVFDLGGTCDIESFALWNGGAGGIDGTFSGIRDFTLEASSDASFSNFTSLGNFTANRAPTTGGVSAQIFTFSSTTAAFVRFSSLNNYGSSTTTINEVAFKQSVTGVPEPSSLAMLLVAGTIGMVHRRRRARKIESDLDT